MCLCEGNKMTRQKKEERKQQVKAIIYLNLQKVGYFDYWLDEHWFFPIVAKTCNCSEFFVRMMWKEIEKENPEYISELEY